MRTIHDAFMILSREHNQLVQVNQLPVDVFIHIASYLRVREICNAMTVCSLWNEVLSGTRTLWANVCLKIDMTSNRMAQWMDAITRRTESTPLSVHMKRVTGNIPRSFRDSDFQVECNGALKLAMCHLRCLALEDEMHLWRDALRASAPGLQVLHLRTPFEHRDPNPVHWDNKWFGNGYLPNLRAIYLAGIHLMDVRHVFPTVTLVSFASADAKTRDLIAIFKSFPNITELRWVLERNLYDDDFTQFRLSPTCAISSPVSLRHVYVTEDLGTSQIQTLFGQVEDLVISFRGDKQRGRIDDERADASAEAFLTPAGATVVQIGWHRISCTLDEDLDLEIPIDTSDLGSTSAYISFNGRRAGVDIPPTRLNLVLKQWANSAALERIESLCLPLSIWQRMMVAGIPLPRIRRLSILISAVCCLVVPYPHYHLDYLEVNRPSDSSDEAARGSLEGGSKISLAGFSAANSRDLDERGLFYQFHLERSFSKYGHESDLTRPSGFPLLSSIKPPVKPLALEVLRLELTDDADVGTQLASEDFSLFVGQLLPSGHILTHLELGGGLQLSGPGFERVGARTNRVHYDSTYCPLPNACRPWYFQMPHEFD